MHKVVSNFTNQTNHFKTVTFADKAILKRGLSKRTKDDDVERMKEQRKKNEIYSIKIASKNKSKNLIIFEAVPNREFIHIISLSCRTHANTERKENVCEDKIKAWHGVMSFEFYKIFNLIRVSSRFAAL